MPDVLNLKNLKTISGIKLIFCFHWSYKKYAILGYAEKYSWPVSLQIFYLRLVRLINFNTWVPLLHCTCFECNCSLFQMLLFFACQLVSDLRSNLLKLISNHLWMLGLKLFLSVRLFVTKFSQDWYISFSDIVHGDSWPWYLVTDNDFLGGKNGSLNLGQMGQNWTQNHVFFCSLVFLPMAYNDNLEQCLTSSGGKIHDKKI